MDPHVEGKIYRMFLEVEDTENELPFLRELGGRVTYSSCRGPARRGFHKIEIREYRAGEHWICGTPEEDMIQFLELPKKVEKMIMLGWTPDHS